MATKQDWDKLVFSKYDKEEIKNAVVKRDWQKHRFSMIGQSNNVKYRMLNQWLKKKRQSKIAKVQVTNYVNALKRAGLIK